MAEKREHSSASDSHSCSSKLVCPVSIVSLLICTAALVRVEIVNQRVHSVEDLLAKGRQIQELVKVSTDAPSYKHSKRVESAGELDNKVTKEGRDATEAPPRVQLAPGTTYVKSGQKVTLPKCHVTGFPAPVITWRKLPGSLPKNRTVQDGGVLTVGDAEKHDIGAYVCNAKNYLGEASAVTSLVVWSVPKFNTKPPEMVYKMTGDELSLSCSATGDPPPTVSWKRSKGAWEEERMKVHGGSLNISSLTESDSGIYICEAKVPYSTIEARTELVVVEAPFLTATSSCAMVQLTDTSGIIRPSQSSQYSNNMDCFWSFSSNAMVEIVFFRFDTESNYDHVYVYNGGSPSSPLIGRFNGSSIPAPITSSSNKLYVRFTSDGSNVNGGFVALYHGLY
ncbi:Immunoglobulin C-2 Type [Desmophyllum pertusum]|uniref:Immunoglobulin C-2 Type n=1 Tax=Desmophyllum pertusum TaxID=174260 RepID=A0A9W9YTY6_9CNID|nr:Immunoglobulin C-2 Type [Desmophyllum pertusum]